MTALAHEQMTWTPSLAESERSLGSMYAEMPKDPAATVPWYVRCLENPESSLALAGAIDLFGHDCIHILLGRGLLGQDEAFVIGYTMGASRRSSPWQERLFRFCARHVYQGSYRFGAADAEVFSLASRAAQCSPGAALHDVDFRSWWEQPVGELRAALGLSSDFLRTVYAREALSFPHTAASQRLATLSLPALHRAGPREPALGNAVATCSRSCLRAGAFGEISVHYGAAIRVSAQDSGEALQALQAAL